MVKKNINEERKFVSRLIYKVLTDSLSIKDSLLNYPKDTDDESLKAAYHALMHREADEDLRKTDLLYKEEQDSFLEFVAQTFEKGESLPDNVIKSYKNYYKDINTPRAKGMKGLIKNLCKFLNV